MSTRFLARAGMTTLNILVIVAAIILLATFGWAGYSYFSNTNQTVTENRNGTIVTTVLRPTVRGFFSQVAWQWRPVKGVAAAEGGMEIEKYTSNLPVGPLVGDVFGDEDVSEPVEVEPETNTNSDDEANDNTNSAEPTNSNANVNSNQNSNTSSDDETESDNNDNVNSNTNDDDEESNSNTSINTNEGADEDEDENDDKNTNQSDDEGRNENQNSNTNGDEEPEDDTNTPTNINVAPSNENLNTTGNINSAPNVNDAGEETPPAEVISGDDWRRQVPRGRGFLQVNWFCSAAYTHLSLVKTDGGSISLGDFTGDCNNTAVSVKGMFLPQELANIDLSGELNFRLRTEWYDGDHVNETATNNSLCVIDYIKGAGHRDVYAAQYTCDEGLGIGGANDDIQFTVYAFPSSWTFPKERTDLYTGDELKVDADGDGFVLREELRLGTNPNHWDTDTDNLGDFEEVEKYETDPLQSDTDEDGHKDYIEVNNRFNPLGPGAATAAQLQKWGAAPNQPGKATISNVQATHENGTLNIAWDVEPAADGIVNFGPSDSYGTYRNNTAFVTHHSISYAVSPGQIVHYAIRSCTPAPNSACTTTNDAVFEVPN